MSTQETIFDLIITAEAQQKVVEDLISTVGPLISAIEHREQHHSTYLQSLTDVMYGMKNEGIAVRTEFSKSFPKFKDLIENIMREEIDNTYANSTNKAADTLKKEFGPVIQEINQSFSKLNNIKKDLNLYTRYVRGLIIVLGVGAFSFVVLSFGLVEMKRQEYGVLVEEYAKLRTDYNFYKNTAPYKK